MAYREFYNVGDTRPLPSGFDKGFKPDIPTKEEVEAVKQKQAQEAQAAAIKDPRISFEKAVELDQQWIAPQIEEARNDFVSDMLVYKKPTPETEKKISTVKANIAKGVTDIAAAKAIQDGYSKNAALQDAVNAEVVRYNTTDPAIRPNAQQFQSEIEQKLPALYNVNIAASDFTKTLAEQESKRSNITDVDGIANSTEFIISSKVKDGKVDGVTLEKFYSADPLIPKAIDYRRQVNDIERVNSLNHKIGTVRKQNTDGTFTTEIITFDSPKELADAVAQGTAYPSENNGTPLKGFESGFNTQERNNRIASNYIMGAAGLNTTKETKIKIDQEKAPKNSFLGKRTLNNDVNLEESTVEGIGADSSLVVDALVQGQDIPNAQYNDRPFIATSINTKEGIQPVTIKNSTFKLANNEGTITTDLNVNGFMPVFFDAEGKIAVAPSNYTEQEKINYYKNKSGLKPGLLMIGVSGKADEDKQQVVVEIPNATDPNFVNFSKRAFNKVGAKETFNGFVNKNPDMQLIPTVKNEKAFSANKLTKTGKPKTKRKF
jgi:hypothetical protein